MRVENREPRVHHLGQKAVLMPGVNEIDDKVWAEFRDLSVIKAKLDKHDLVVGGPSKSRD